MDIVTMKSVELYGGQFDGLTFKLLTQDDYFVYEFISFVDSQMVFIDFHYISSKQFNPNGNEKFYFSEVVNGFASDF